MQTKPLLYGLIGFFLGGLVVSVAATTFDKANHSADNSSMSSMSMDDMSAELKNKKGDKFDKAFISNMIAHHEGAVDMAEQSSKNAKHDEIKQLSKEIISAQEKEISQMRQWQLDWGYNSSNTNTHSMH